MRYIAYCRKSTDEKTKQILSIESQRNELKEYADREGIEVVDYLTECKTAKSPGRLVFNKLLGLIESGSVDGILSWHPDRLARNSIDGGKIIYLLDTGVLKDLKFPTLQFDNTPQGKFMLSIAFGQSKYYVDNLSENVKRGNRHKLKLGIWPNKAPFGYINDKNTKTIHVNKEEAEIVKGAYELFSLGDKSFTEIAYFMFNGGITKGDGQPLKVNQVKRMLTRTFYVGQLKYGGEIYEASHPQFITKELFAKVQKQIKLKDFSRPRREGRAFNYTGLIKCKECGSSITAEQHTKHYKRTSRTVTYSYYRCTKKAGVCKQPYITKQELNNQLTKSVSSVALPSSWQDRWLDLLAKDKLKAKQDTLTCQTTGKQETIATNKQLNLLLDLYLEQAIDTKEYKDRKNKLTTHKLELKDKVSSNGSGWLEPLSEFIDTSIQAEKIAQKENMESNLKQIAQSLGSNFFLEDTQLKVEYRKPFASLRVATCTRATLSSAEDMAASVTPRRIELRLPG
jgi:site-specific DNA recombinase